MTEWINDPQLWSHLFRSLPVHFLPICFLMLFNLFPPLWWYLSRFVCQCVHVDKEPSLLSCLTTFHHLSNWSLCYKTFSFTSRGVQRRTKCSVTLWPRRGFAVIREILLFIEVVPLFPAGSCPMPLRTLQPCWAHLKKELSTWRGPSLLMETVPSYATYWRFLRTVSQVITSQAFLGHILPSVLCTLCVSLHNLYIYKLFIRRGIWQRGNSAFELTIAAISEEGISCSCLLFHAAKLLWCPSFPQRLLSVKQLEKSSTAWSRRLKKECPLLLLIES